MSATSIETSTPKASATENRIRLWPGVALAVLLVLWRFGLPMLNGAWAMQAAMGALVISALILLWWLFGSRLPWKDRLLGVGVIALACLVVPPLLHRSLAEAGYGMMFWIYAIPAMFVALVLAAALTASSSAAMRRVTVSAAVFAACLVWAAVRFEGADGAFAADLSPRWSQTAEERLVAAGPVSTVSATPSDTPEYIDTAAGWPGFRGANRDSKVPALRIGTDWQSAPPKELWQRAVGPGWSSMSVAGDLLYTQEQRGEDEVVAAYRISDGQPVWQHTNAVRFWEAIGGAGPRATPTPHRGVVYALGATGLLNALDANTGEVRWSRDTIADTGAKIPEWGISGSPLVLADTIYVAVSGVLAAYRSADGEQLWSKSVTGEGYSSPHLRRTASGDQILLLHPKGLSGYTAEDGQLLFEHEWEGAPIVQPAFTADGDLLIGVTDRSGVRRLSLREDPAGRVQLEEKWTSIRLKPYFNDFVVHGNHAYGFDGRILACIDLEDGSRVWKGGRYGNGQLVLLTDQDLLVVLSEDGDLALVRAHTEGYEEVAKIEALEGKTWNHPTIAGHLLLVRNAEEMAAFELPKA